MRKMSVQMSMYDTYTDVSSAMENEKSKFIQMLEEHIKFEELIPYDFYHAFYRRYGRPRDYPLEGFMRFFVLQKILGIIYDSTLLTILTLCKELREFCGFEKVPDASKITRFRQDFVGYIEMMFNKLVALTEPICREIDAKKADYLIYDPTGISAYVSENNPKFLNARLVQAKKLSKKNPQLQPHSLAYSLMPECAGANPFVKQQYINGHFCYAHKAGVLTNGIGVVRGISFFDDRFKRKHPEVLSQKTDNPDTDKEIGDSSSLRPVLSDFFKTHPTFSYKTFLADASFDSYDNYSMLRNEFHFDRIAIPLNLRNSGGAHGDFDENGTPVCPIDKTPFTFIGTCGGENRSMRFKWVCHNSVRRGSKRVCVCDNPCTTSSYGRCVYTYPDKNLRLYPGIPRGTQHWDNLYRYRVLVERNIHSLKNTLGSDYRKSFSSRTAKADLFLAGITQLIGVILAKAFSKLHLAISVRKLLSA